MEVGWSLDGGWMVSRWRLDGQQMAVGCLVDCMCEVDVCVCFMYVCMCYFTNQISE